MKCHTAQEAIIGWESKNTKAVGKPTTRTNNQVYKSIGTGKQIACVFVGKFLLEAALVVVLSKFGEQIPPLLMDFMKGQPLNL